MKLAVMSFVSLLSISALACPTFNGEYECKGEGMEQTLNVKTEVVNGVHQYSLDDTTVIADGQFRKVNFQGGLYDMAASCKNQTLDVKILFDGGEGDSPECGTQKWNLLYVLSFTENGKNITENHAASLMCEDGKTFPTDDMTGSMNCVKK